MPIIKTIIVPVTLRIQEPIRFTFKPKAKPFNWAETVELLNDGGGDEVTAAEGLVLAHMSIATNFRCTYLSDDAQDKIRMFFDRVLEATEAYKLSAAAPIGSLINALISNPDEGFDGFDDPRMNLSYQVQLTAYYLGDDLDEVTIAQFAENFRDQVGIDSREEEAGDRVLTVCKL